MLIILFFFNILKREIKKTLFEISPLFTLSLKATIVISRSRFTTVHGRRKCPLNFFLNDLVSVRNNFSEQITALNFCFTTTQTFHHSAFFLLNYAKKMVDDDILQNSNSSLKFEIYLKQDLKPFSFFIHLN